MSRWTIWPLKSKANRNGSRDLLRRFEALDNLSEHDKTLAKKMLDLLILKNQFKVLAGANTV